MVRHPVKSHSVTEVFIIQCVIWTGAFRDDIHVDEEACTFYTLVEGVVDEVAGTLPTPVSGDLEDGTDKLDTQAVMMLVKWIKRHLPHQR